MTDDMDYVAAQENLRDWVMQQFGVSPWEVYGIDRDLYHLVMQVVEHPDEEQYRGVLADWLEERGDERGPKVRATVGRRPYPSLVGPTWGNYVVRGLVSDCSDPPNELYQIMRGLAGNRYLDFANGESWLQCDCPWRLFARGFALWFGLPDPGDK